MIMKTFNRRRRKLYIFEWKLKNIILPIYSNFISLINNSYIEEFQSKVIEIYEDMIRECFPHLINWIKKDKLFSNITSLEIILFLNWILKLMKKVKNS